MILVKTYIRASPIHGIGVFAAEPIAKGTPMWRFMPDFDRRLSNDELKVLPKITLNQIRHYLYFDRTLKAFILCMDDARFYNHSEHPNTGMNPETENPELDVALRDIQAGEEILCDYRSFTDELGF